MHYLLKASKNQAFITMANSIRSFQSIASTEPSPSSSLLGWTNSASSYTSAEITRRPVTPADEIIREEVWYNTLRSTFYVDWANTRESFDGLWFSKLEAILRCLCLPFCVLIHALNGRRRYFRQHGVMYLYIYFGFVVVFNLLVAVKNKSSLLKYTQVVILFSMVGAILCMLYLSMKVYRTATFRASRGAFLRIFYEGGLYVFGFASFGYSVAVVVDYDLCDKELHVLYSEVTGVKAAFTFLQIVFFHFFYGARIPNETPYIQFILAHLLGTNLVIWFWMLCADAVDNPEECIGRVQKYFSPLFVEFLLLAASLFYQIWKDLKSQDATLPALMQHRCTCNECQSRLYRNLLAGNAGDSQSEISSNARSNPGARSRSLHPGPIIGGCFAAWFIVLIVFANVLSGKYYNYHVAYSVGSIILSLAQMCACYICQLSLQFHQRDPERYQGNPQRFVLDQEDILLYFSLLGIVLWHGFHAYSLVIFDSDAPALIGNASALIDNASVLIVNASVLIDNASALIDIAPALIVNASAPIDNVSAPIDLVADIVDVLQALFQTTTLVNLRSRQHTSGQSQVWLRECLLFLVATNLSLWFGDSFYIEIDITTPGERYKGIQHDLGTIGFFVHPLSIFYRFHSSVCCVLAWYIFGNR